MDCAVVIVAAAPSAVVVVGGVEDDDKSNEDNVKRLALFLSLRLDLFIRVEVCLLVGWLFNVLIHGLCCCHCRCCSFCCGCCWWCGGRRQEQRR